MLAEIWADVIQRASQALGQFFSLDGRQSIAHSNYVT